MISVRMNSLFSPIESGFRNRGDVPTITAGITANYGNDSLFLRCLPFQWKWFWMLLSNQILRQVLRLSHPFSSIRWVFDPGINIEYLKYWICIGQTKELWAYPCMELKNYERNTITNKEFVGSIHGLTLEGYGQTAGGQAMIASVRPWKKRKTNNEYNGRTNSKPNPVRRSWIRKHWYLIVESKLHTKALGFRMLCGTLKFSQDWLANHAICITRRSNTENENNGRNLPLANKPLFRKHRQIQFSCCYRLQYMAHICLCKNLFFGSF